jgi:alkylhydroperoxidase family enzyme
LALSDPAAVEAALADPDTAPVSEALRVTLTMLAALTERPDAFGPAELAAARAAGVSDEALADAILVCALFNMIDRCADALGFELPEVFDPQRLLTMGYLPPAPPEAAAAR